MKQIRLAATAQTDLIEIWSGIAEHSSDNAADQIIDHLAKTYETLAQFPEMGRCRDELFPGYRSFVVSPYLIFIRFYPTRFRSFEFFMVYEISQNSFSQRTTFPSEHYFP